MQLKTSEWKHTDIEIQNKIKKDLKGKQILDDKIIVNGKSWSLYAYYNMLVRTETTNRMIKYYAESMEEFGDDLVHISSHADTSPLCKPWQGSVYSVSGENDKYPKLSIATDGGLFHPNCRHYMGVYYEDITDIQHIPDKELDTDQYLLNQEMRYNEQMIRKWKQRHYSNPSDSTKEKLKFWRSKAYSTNRVGKILLDPPEFTQETSAKIAEATLLLQAKQEEIKTHFDSVTPEDVQNYINGLDAEKKQKFEDTLQKLK